MQSTKNPRYLIWLGLSVLVLLSTLALANGVTQDAALIIKAVGVVALICTLTLFFVSVARVRGLRQARSKRRPLG